MHIDLLIYSLIRVFTNSISCLRSSGVDSGDVECRNTRSTGVGVHVVGMGGVVGPIVDVMIGPVGLFVAVFGVVFGFAVVGVVGAFVGVVGGFVGVVGVVGGLVGLMGDVG